MNRREFLAGGAILSLGLGAGPVWRRAAAAVEARPDMPVLVVVELSGGNDGLNTVVPYADDIYQRSRPFLRIGADKVLKLTDRVGLHPDLKELRALYDAGQVALVQNVGYPDPNRSHFRSMQIWQAGGVEPAPVTGWLGKAADRSAALGLCQVGTDALPLALRRRAGTTASITSVAECRLRPPARIWGGSAATTAPLDAVAAEMGAASELAARLEPVADAGTDADTLAGRLASVRALVGSGAPYRVYYTSLGGFDTHAGQRYAHPALLRTLSQALAEFCAGLQAEKLDGRVVVLVFSEFGRRLRENDQHGTDHGAAAPVLLIGKPVRGGLIGPPPDLADLEDGDVKYKIDFRQVYATLLRRWLAVDPVLVLGGEFAEVRILS